MKRCVHCNASKPTGEFPAMPKCRDGLSSWCRACHRAAAREHHRLTYVPRPRIARELEPTPLRTAACRGCSASFIRQPGAAGRSRRYCSADCAAGARRQSRRGARPGHHPGRRPRLAVSEKPCLHCGANFVGTRGRKFCKPRCGRLWHRNFNVYVRRTAGSHWRADRVTRVEIAARDGWVCGICHHSIDPTLKAPHPLSQSLDHIRPVSKGGAHVLTNLQLAHFGCNSRKSARVA